jgi:hypothetical protein
MGRTTCTESQCLYKGALYLYLTVELYLYSPYGSYDLYRVSVPVQGCTLPLPYSRAIPLLPLWFVRPVQRLSACTRVHFNFTINIPVRAALASDGSKSLITQDGSHYQFQLPVGPQDVPPLSISRISTLKRVPRVYVDSLCSPR